MKTIYDEPLDYVQSRKEIYVPVYKDLVTKENRFYELKDRLKSDENILIVEVDGSHQESLDYYKNKYSVSNNFIESNTMLATVENLNIMLNDPKHPYGHRYCLAEVLLTC